MTQINELNRYSRQELIKGWDQKKLEESLVTIVGSDVLAQYIVIPLVALGVGSMRLIDSGVAQRDMFLDFELRGKSRVKSLEQKLAEINPNVRVNGLNTDLISDASQYFLEKSDLVIDATNNPRSKALCLDYCVETNTPLIVTSCMEGFGKLRNYNDEGRDVVLLFPEFYAHFQDEFISMVLGGIVAEETKKILMKDMEPLKNPVYYNLLNADRFTYKINGQAKPRELGEFNDKKVLMIGAGALGSFAGLGLAHLGVGQIDIMDFDVVEDTNLNRQILYYDAVGQEKARALAEKLKNVGRGFIKTNAIIDKFTPKTKLKLKYDLILDCVDNFVTRAMINEYAAKNKIPLISGGTDYRAGQAAVYVPGKTSCMDCQLNIREHAKKAEQRARQSCVLAPQPSVIMSNQVIGGLMVNEVKTVLNPAKYGEPVNGVLKYTSDLDFRLGYNPIKKVCNCYSQRLKIIGGGKK
ncbi:hypothetical protein AYK26_01405 [Euryarchaeota archaeon SM23-78]|nr:MAG: hypothetical protein AYK26_01405 [Euryarchaeota archaeon SM23-78]MBW3001254.1 ThiF family adenylyltransferase [Candidatus Woesearchaeota archaeon]